MTDSRTKNLKLKLGGLSCSFCTQNIEKLFKGVAGVKQVSVSLAHSELLAVYYPDKITPRQIKGRIRQLGYKIQDPNKAKSLKQEAEGLQDKKRKLILSGIFTGLALLIMMAMWTGFHSSLFLWIMMGLALFTIIWPGFFIMRMPFNH